MVTLLLPDPLADAAEQRARLHGRLDVARDRLACVVSAFLDALEDPSEAVRVASGRRPLRSRRRMTRGLPTLGDAAEVRL